MFEDELIPLFEKCGSIWDLRLMMDPMTGTNRGYAFVTFTGREAAQNAVKEVTLLGFIGLFLKYVFVCLLFLNSELLLFPVDHSNRCNEIFMFGIFTI